MARGLSKFCPEFSQEKGKKERKGKEKRRKKGKRKKGGVGIHSNKVGSFPTWDILVYATQWPWSLAPTWGLVQNSLGQTVVCFLSTFGC